MSKIIVATFNWQSCVLFLTISVLLLSGAWAISCAANGTWFCSTLAAEEQYTSGHVWSWETLEPAPSTQAVPAWHQPAAFPTPFLYTTSASVVCSPANTENRPVRGNIMAAARIIRFIKFTFNYAVTGLQEVLDPTFILSDKMSIIHRFQVNQSDIRSPPGNYYMTKVWTAGLAVTLPFTCIAWRTNTG